jgi:hypothetical protein
MLMQTDLKKGRKRTQVPYISFTSVNIRIDKLTRLSLFQAYCLNNSSSERFNDYKAAWKLADASQRRNRAYHSIAHIGPINKYFCVSIELLEKFKKYSFRHSELPST